MLLVPGISESVNLESGFTALRDSHLSRRRLPYLAEMPSFYGKLQFSNATEVRLLMNNADKFSYHLRDAYYLTDQSLFVEDSVSISSITKRPEYA